jgi:type II secretory pathway component PulK
MLAFAQTLRSSLALKQSSLLIERFQQEQLALAACARARLILSEDDPNTDWLGESWCGQHALAADVHRDRSAGDETSHWEVAWRLTDEAAKINVNLAPLDLLLELEYLDEAMVASILDWIDEDDVPNPDGAEDDFYHALESPHNCKNAPLDSIDELLLIKGMLPQVFCEPMQTRCGDNQGDCVELSELLTVCGDGRININTASKHVLQAIPLLGDAAVEYILSRQKSRSGKFMSIDDIEGDNEFTIADKLALIGAAKFSTSFFRLDVTIRRQNRPFPCRFMAIIERQDKATKIRRWQRIARIAPRNLKDIGRRYVKENISEDNNGGPSQGTTDNK